MRSSWYGFTPRSSSNKMEPRVSSSHGVPIDVSISVMQPPSSVPVGRAARKCFASQRRGPAAVRRRHRAHECVRIVAARGVRARVKSAGHQRPVKRDPPQFLPQKNLDGRQIAEPAKNSGLLEAVRFQPSRISALPYPPREQKIARISGCAKASCKSLRRSASGAEKYPSGLRFLSISLHPVVEPLQVFAPALDPLFLRGTAGATTAIVLPGTSASGLRGFGMEGGGKKEVYNAPAKRNPIHSIPCCRERNEPQVAQTSVCGGPSIHTG